MPSRYARHVRPRRATAADRRRSALEATQLHVGKQGSAPATCRRSQFALDRPCGNRHLVVGVAELQLGER